MPTPLEIYKNDLIGARRATYNADVSRTSTYYQGLINGVNANIVLSRRAKINNINALIRARTNALNAIKSAFNKDIAVINKIKVVPRTTPIKQATLVGINYIGTPNRLNGCINDTVLISTLLQTQFGYDAANISFMTDDTSVKPTRANILNAFTKLLSEAQSGDSLFFFYSGHGTQKNNSNNPNPADKIDECIYPIDGKIITDIELKRIVDANLKQGVTLSVIFDSCFSGTVMNLRYNYLNGNAGDQLVVDTYAAETRGNVVCISGCKDAQTSSDAFLEGNFNGALTWAMTKTITTAAADEQPLSWNQMMSSVRTLLTASNFTQIAQFSSGKAIDMTAAIAF
jgi:hypothetical protein